MAALDDLIAAIDADPDDDERYLVLADALLAAVDPWGELVTVHHQLVQRPRDPDLLRAVVARTPAAWGPLARWRRGLWGDVWRLGFLDEIKIDHGILAAYGEPTISELLATLADAPVSRWLRSLSSGMRKRQFDGDARLVLGLRNLRALRIVDGGGLGDAELHAFAGMPRLATLTLGHCALTVDGIASIPEPTALRALRFVGIEGFGDAHLAATARLPWLRRLGVHGGGITDRGVARVGESVRELELSYCEKITSGVMQHLAARPLVELEVLTHDVFAGSALAQLTHGTLTRLAIGSITELDSALRALARHASLRDLELAGRFNDREPVHASALAGILAVPALRRLELRSVAPLVDDVSLESSIEELDISFGAVPDRWTARLAKLPLHTLDLSALPPRNSWVDDAAVASLGDLPRLVKLSLEKTRLTDVGLRSVGRFVALTFLDLSECAGITGRGLGALSKLPLRDLDLSSCPQIDSVSPLADLHTLLTLDMRATKITDADLSILAGLPELRELGIGHTRITDAGVATLLPLADRLQHLDLSECAITGATVGTLRRLHRLETLKLDGTGLSDDNIAELVAALPACRVSSRNQR